MNDGDGKDVRMTDFDYLFADPRLQMMKAVIPYMALPQQRVVSTIIKMQELNRARNLFSGEEVTAMGLAPQENKSPSPVELLQIMKPYAGPKERDMIELLENVQIMMQTMQTPV